MISIMHGLEPKIFGKEFCPVHAGWWMPLHPQSIQSFLSKKFKIGPLQERLTFVPEFNVGTRANFARPGQSYLSCDTY